jgi:hypothetical protein
MEKYMRGERKIEAGKTCIAARGEWVPVFGMYFSGSVTAPRLPLNAPLGL